MKAIIVAGGKGERFRPFTNTIPKPMIKVKNKPILEHTIELLKKNGITEVILALCYLPKPIMEYFGDGSQFGIKIHYILENPETPLGTAGAITTAREFISDTFVVTYADMLRDLNVTEMVLAHKESGGLATLNSYKHSGNNFKSQITFDKNNQLTHFQELEKGQRLEEGFVWSNGSFYIFEPEIFEYIPKDQKKDFSKDIFPKLLEAKEKITIFPSLGFLFDIGTKESLEEIEKLDFLL